VRGSRGQCVRLLCEQRWGGVHKQQEQQSSHVARGAWPVERHTAKPASRLAGKAQRQWHRALSQQRLAGRYTAEAHQMTCTNDGGNAPGPCLHLPDFKLTYCHFLVTGQVRQLCQRHDLPQAILHKLVTQGPRHLCPRRAFDTPGKHLPHLLCPRRAFDTPGKHLSTFLGGQILCCGPLLKPCQNVPHLLCWDREGFSPAGRGAACWR